MAANSQSPYGNPVSQLTITYNTFGDSTITQRESLSYDEEGNLKSNVSYIWNASAKKWIGSSRYESQKDQSKNETTSIQYYWDNDSSIWVASSKSITKTNAAGKTLSYSYWYWNRTNRQWYGSNRSDFVWNQGGKLEMQTYSSWSFESKGFVPYYRVSFLYDKDWNEILNMSYTYTKSSGWNLTGKTVSTYTSRKIQNITVYSYLAQYDSFAVYSVQNFNYDLAGRLLTSQNLQGLGYYGPGIYSNKSDMIYDSHGNLKEQANYSYSTDSLKYLKNDRSVHVINDKGLTTYYAYYYGYNLPDWWLAYESEITLGTDGKPIQSMWKSYEWGTSNIQYNSREDMFYDKNGNKTESVYWTKSYNDEVWFKSNRILYEFEYRVTDVYLPEITVFPNPFSDVLYIGLSEGINQVTRDIYDMNGKKVYTSASESANLSVLPRGIYWLVVKDKNGATLKRTKIVKI